MIEAWRYGKMRDDTAMQMSVRTVLPCLVCPTLLPTLRLDGNAPYHERSTVPCRMVDLGNDTSTRLKAMI